MKNFSFENLSDVTDAKELVESGFMNKSAVYALFNRKDFPTVILGKRKFVTKKALMGYFGIIA